MQTVKFPVPDTPECVHSHCGLWACESWTLETLYRLAIDRKLETADTDELERRRSARTELNITESGIAVLKLHGVMQRGESKFSGVCSTNRLRRELRLAAAEPAVKGVLLYINSPGGSAAGMGDLERDLLKTAAAKPVWSYIEDIGCSGALWAAARTGRIYAEPMAFIGSIGVYSVVYDQSGQAEREGIKVHVLSTGKYKGAGVPGSTITEEQLADWQKSVEDINRFFLAAVSEGRKLSPEDTAALADGRSHIAAEAKKLNLIDEIGDFEETLKAFEQFLTQGAEMKQQNEDLRATPAAKAAEDGAVPEEEKKKPEDPEKEEESAEEQEEEKKEEKPPEEEAKRRKCQDQVAAFQALADAEGYEFARQHFGKSEREITAARLAKRDAEIEALKSELAARTPAAATGADPIPAAGQPARQAKSTGNRIADLVRDAKPVK